MSWYKWRYRGLDWITHLTVTRDVTRLWMRVPWKWPGALHSQRWRFYRSLRIDGMLAAQMQTTLCLRYKNLTSILSHVETANSSDTIHCCSFRNVSTNQYIYIYLWEGVFGKLQGCEDISFRRHIVDRLPCCWHLTFMRYKLMKKQFSKNATHFSPLFWVSKVDNDIPAQIRTHLAPPESWGRYSPGMVWPCWSLCSFAACRLYTRPLPPERRAKTHRLKGQRSENEKRLHKLFATTSSTVMVERPEPLHMFLS